MNNSDGLTPTKLTVLREREKEKETREHDPSHPRVVSASTGSTGAMGNCRYLGG